MSDSEPTAHNVNFIVSDQHEDGPRGLAVTYSYPADGVGKVFVYPFLFSGDPISIGEPGESLPSENGVLITAEQARDFAGLLSRTADRCDQANQRSQ